MSEDDVHGYEMNEPPDFDDTAAESLLSGANRGADPELSDVLGDMRVAYTSHPPAVGPALAALIGSTEPAPAPRRRRFERMHSSIIAKIASAAATAIFATGGLAAAHALPAPMQDAVSKLGVGQPAHEAGTTEVQSTTTEPSTREAGDTTSTTVASPDNPNDTSTTVADGTTPTTMPEHGHDGVSSDHHDGDHHDQSGCESDGQQDQSGQDQPDVTTSTVAPPATPCIPTTDPTTPGNNGHDGTDGSGDANATVTSLPTTGQDHRDQGSSSDSSGSHDGGSTSSPSGGPSGGGSGSGGGN